MQMPYPQLPKLARPLSPAGQRPAEVNTVLAIAGGDSRFEISTLTDDQKALHTAKVTELLNMDKFGVVEVVDRPQSKQVLSTRWVSKQRLDGCFKVRLVVRGFEQTVSSGTGFYAGTPTYVKKRAQRSEDSILLRHMDDVVGTGPEEHLMSDFEHVKTSLY